MQAMSVYGFFWFTKIPINPKGENVMKEYLQDAGQVMDLLKTNSSGLSEEQAAARLSQHGANKLTEAKKDGPIKKFIKELADPMTIVLLAAALVSGITAVWEGESFVDTIIILAVVLINAVLGVFQESKAEKAIEALQEIAAATSKVLRGGKIRTVKSEELTIGDIILLEAGDAVPADARIIECASLKAEESALTGESVPVSKTAEALQSEQNIPLADRKNLVYTGSTIAYGRARAVVCAVGMNTEMGRIASALENAREEKTPLQKKLAQLSKILSILVLIICAVVFAADIIRAYPAISGDRLLDTFMVAVSLAVAAIPEGLAAVVTIVLSIGVTNMSKRSAVIRKLTAVETLGCTDVICSDKTGTLTKNKMTVTSRVSVDEQKLAAAMALCSDAEQGADGEATGEPTECALVNDAAQLGMTKESLSSSYPRIGEAPFDSTRKMMTTLHRDASGAVIQFTKGAPDVVLARCTHELAADGSIIELTEHRRAQILAENKKMADSALRVLCAAMREWDITPENEAPEYLEQQLCYIGLSGMIDPIRPEVKAAIAECRHAGIRPVMITGDHRDTAVAIAKELGIITSGSEAITGVELDALSDEELADKITGISVYARVQPEHKVRIVNAWQKKGKIVAMTGDGVNDAPSIKSADIGVGMGITGTDVTKNVADMVLADDNFATIVLAVSQGRRIYDNIRKAIQFLLSSNLAEVLSIFTATLLGFTILKPVHLLWINLITDCFPALALGTEPAEEGIMDRPPRSSAEGIFAGGMGVDIAVQGIIITLLTLASYLTGHRIESGLWVIAESPDGISMAFLTLSLVEIFHSFNMRSRRSSLLGMKSKNPSLNFAAIGSLLATVLVLYVPFLRNAFGFEYISLFEFAAATGIAVLILPIIEIIKLILRKKEKKRKRV